MMQCEIRLKFLIHTPNLFKSPMKYRHSTSFILACRYRVVSVVFAPCAPSSFLFICKQLKFVLRLRGFVWGVLHVLHNVSSVGKEGRTGGTGRTVSSCVRVGEGR